MKTKTLDKLAWILIYSGLGVIVVGSFVRDLNPPIGWLMIAVGALDALSGAVLIVLRSRLKQDSTDKESP